MPAALLAITGKPKLASPANLHHSTHRNPASRVVRPYAAKAASADAYVAPSSRTGATELVALERLSEVNVIINN